MIAVDFIDNNCNGVIDTDLLKLVLNLSHGVLEFHLTKFFMYEFRSNMRFDAN